MPRIREMVKSIKVHPFTGMLHSYKNVQEFFLKMFRKSFKLT